MKYVLDTNFLFSLLISSDVNHPKALRKFQKFSNSDNFIIPSIVVAELLASGENYSFIEALNLFTNQFEFSSIKDLYYIESLDSRTRRSLKANDCLIISIAIRKDAELVTFDKKLKNKFNTLKSNL